MSVYRASPLGKIRAVVIALCLLLILGIFGYAYLNDKNNSVLSKDDILGNIEATNNSDFGYNFVSSYLKKYGLKNINTVKLNSVESTLESEFYKALPEEKDLAKAITLLFLENYYDTVNLDDSEAVTDAVLKCMFNSIGDNYTGVLKELRRRQYFTKPSIEKRERMQHAIYVEHMYRDEE